MGYTNRTYGAPTVRFVGQGDEDTEEGEFEEDTLDMEGLDDGGEASGSDDSDSILNFCNQLDEEEANEAMHKLTFEEHLDVLEDPIEEEEFDELRDLDEDDKLEVQTMMGKPEDSVTTDTETVINFDQDVQSLCSFESFTPTMTQRDEDVNELDNISAKTFFKEDNQDNMSGRVFPTQDNQDNTFPKRNNQDNLSARTFLKQASIPKPGRQREADLGQLSSRTYDLSNCSSLQGSRRGSQRLRDNSSVSTCSWTDMYRGALEPSDGRSGIVPSLSLASVTSDTSTFYKNLEENKERHTQAAFEDWKARKEAQKQKSILAAKQEKEKREAEAALRQQQSQARFQEWCRRKEEQQQQQRKKPMSMIQSSSGNSSGSTSSSGSVSAPVTGPLAARKAASEATRKRLKEWQLTKTEQQQRERERKRRLEENKQKLEEERKQRSQGAWKNWMKQVDKRAKPVPLNQGFDTLRGTISNIYINPVQWVSNIDPKDSGRSR